jgi:hypothetical protein
MSWTPAARGIVPWRPLSYAIQPSAIRACIKKTTVADTRSPIKLNARPLEGSPPRFADRSGSHLHDFSFFRAQREIDLADELIRQFLDLAFVAFLVVLADRLILELFS